MLYNLNSLELFMPAAVPTSIVCMILQNFCFASTYRFLKDHAINGRSIMREL